MEATTSNDLQIHGRHAIESIDQIKDVKELKVVTAFTLNKIFQRQPFGITKDFENNQFLQASKIDFEEIDGRMVDKLNVPTTLAEQACFYKRAFNTLLPNFLGIINKRDVPIDELVGEPLTRNKLTGIESWVTDGLVYKEGSSRPLGAVKTPKIGTAFASHTHYCVHVGFTPYGPKSFKEALADVFERTPHAHLKLERWSQGYMLESCAFAATVHLPHTPQEALIDMREDTMNPKYLTIDKKAPNTTQVYIREEPSDVVIPKMHLPNTRDQLKDNTIESETKRGETYPPVTDTDFASF